MKKRLTTFFSLILMFSSGVQAQEFESAADAVKNMGVGWIGDSPRRSPS